MTTITPTIIESEPYAVDVRWACDLDKAPEGQLIFQYDLVNEMVAYHYDVCHEPFETEDIYSEGAAEYLRDYLQGVTGQKCTMDLAYDLMMCMADDIEATIKTYDDYERSE